MNDSQITETKSLTPIHQPKTGPRGELTIYATWCKGCHICVEFCPPKVLEINPTDDHPVIAHPERCTACHFCDTHCPDLAIVVRKLG